MRWLTSQKATATATETSSTPWRAWRDREDADADGICDDVDDCVGALDACGVCNGPGEIYECGCADIPEGTDRDGNQLDALEEDCVEDADAGGIATTWMIRRLDACGVCNGPETGECGCADIPEGDCDCDETSSTPLERWR